MAANSSSSRSSRSSSSSSSRSSSSSSSRSSSSSSSRSSSSEEKELGGFPPDLFITPVMDHFNCNICIDVARCPMKCSNEHVFCKYCIEAWMEDHCTCPTCQTVLTKDTLTVARLAANVLAEQAVRCLSACCSVAAATVAPLCSWTGKLKELSAHTRQCPHVPGAHTCQDCSVLVPRGELGIHVNACGHRCGKDVKLNDDRDSQTRCSRRPVLCPNAGCGATLPSDELQAHRDEQCQYEEVACPYSTLGCEYRCIRREMATHSADGLVHITAMMGVVSSLHITVQQQQATMQQLRRELHQQQTAFQQQQTTVKTLEIENKQKVQQLETESRQLKQSIGFVHDTHTWDVEGYTVSSRKVSPVFSVGGFEFKLLLDSNQGGEYKDFTGLHLYITKGWKALVKFDLQIISANDSNISTSHNSEHTYESLQGVGSNILHNQTMQTYLKHGKVTVRAKVSVKMPDVWEVAQVLA